MPAAFSTARTLQFNILKQLCTTMICRGARGIAADGQQV